MPLVMKKIIASFVLLALVRITFAQNYTADTAFFKKQAQNYELWLKNNFANVLTFVENEIVDNKVNLWLRMSNKNDWHGLKKSCNDKNGNTLAETLFKRMIHLYEVPKEDVKIRISDFNSYYVNIYVSDNQIITDEPEPKAYITDATKIPVFDLNDKLIYKISNETKGNTKKILAKLETFLDKKKKKKTGRFDNKAEFNIDIESNEICLHIENITGEILNDEYIGYFEVIDLWIRVEQLSDNKVELKYGLQGKYGSGILWKPRQNDYSDIESDATKKIYLNNYLRILQKEIKKSLTN